MPCYYTGSAEGDAKLSADISRKKLTETTELLCGVMKTLENAGHLHITSQETRDWWVAHKKIDSK